MSLMVIVAIRAVDLGYLVKVLDWGQSQYIFTSSSTQNFLWLWLHRPDCYYA
jgi:hypothetical protein